MRKQCLFVCLMVFNATINNISAISLAVSFTGGGNRRTRRKPPTCRKSLTNLRQTPLPDRDSNSRHQWWSCTDCIGSCKSNYHTITATRAPHIFEQLTLTFYMHDKICRWRQWHKRHSLCINYADWINGEKYHSVQNLISKS